MFDNQGQIKNPALLHPAKRGNFALGSNTPREIYRMDGDAAVLAQTFADWQMETPILAASPITDLDKNKPVSGGYAQDDCYLLCDREPQANAFRKILRGKVQGQFPEPNFIFVNGHNLDGIPELLERFEKYVLPETCPGYTSRVEGMKFPDADSFDLPDDGKKPLLHLEEYYKEQLLNKFGQKFSDDTLLLICHKIYKPFWKEGIESLFRYYLKEYSNTIRQQISERVVVLFFLRHNDSPEHKSTLDNFARMYQKLKTDFPDRVEYFDKLPLIEEPDIVEWHETEFDASLNTLKFPLGKEKMYFVEAKEYMSKIILYRKQNG